MKAFFTSTICFLALLNGGCSAFDSMGITVESTDESTGAVHTDDPMSNDNQRIIDNARERGKLGQDSRRIP